ncbi:Ca2+-binding protein, RTX toxin-related [Nostoc flagelliforme CCNUN1]|uniref:Ca2+-binding protein, RTX toxin-related n=1 Tax=Nostoc flagelliforme CCNUN1 TaxID=2038116 RepID=A0A2K8SGH9_9NOSO|nr:DUF4347 domain-containing protein [Nostoc flagelliforme]AUB34548.1 Ca2+-binding protein, RTX toxin-related [Nostoc flagelliforme CCNUN1]
MLDTISTRITTYPTQDLHEKIPANRLVFIDPKVENYQTLIAGVLPNTSVVVLDNDQDGIEQINQVLASHRGVNSLHIVSHGAPGRVYLGNSQLSNETLNRYAAKLMGWANALSADAQLLLYGCEVAQTEQGMAFVQRLSELTGAVVAASDNLTGSATLGGDWELDICTKASVRSLVFQPEVMAAYTSVLALVLPDKSFDGDGKVTTDLGFIAIDIGRSIAVQNDGKIIVAGDSNGDFALVRYNTNGSLDNSFNGNGKVTTNITSTLALPLSTDIGYSVAVQSDGKIIVAGVSNGDFALVRYNTNGSLDNSFNGNGKVTTNITSTLALPLSTDSGYSVAVQSDGKIIVAGVSNGDFALVRYDTNGSLDTTFSGDGKVTTNISLIDTARSVTLQSDGKIIVAGTDGTDFALVRYNSDGSLDTTFSGDGKVTTDLRLIAVDIGYSVTLQTDGKIIVAGTDNTDFALVRYNSDGSLDTTFGGGDGKVTTDLGLIAVDIGYSVTLQTDGKIIVAGTNNTDFALVRYNSDGSLDSTFNGSGKVTTDLGFLAIDIGYGLAQQSDRKILVAGTNGTDFAVVRYLVDEVPTDLALSQLNVNENVPAGTVIGTFTTTDLDAGDTFTYSLVTGTGDTDNAAFTVVSNQLKINSSPDFETKPSYNIRVQTSDSSGASYQKTLTIAVNNSNDAPTDLTVSQLAVNENVAAGTVIGTFTTTDPDANNIFTYSLVTGTGDTDNAAFTVVSNQLKINSSPDFETKPSYNIRVQTSDSGGASYQKTLTIAVNNLNDAGVNDAPTDLTVSQLAVDENVAAGTVVGIFTTTDPDANNIFTYSLVTGSGDTDNAAFTVEGNQLKINSSPDFETKPSYNIRVQTSDSGGASYQKTLTIAVNNLNDAGVNDAPTDLTVSQLAVDENVAAGTVVGIFTTTDPDANNIFTYSLVTGSGDTDNAAFTVEGNQLKINSSPDFETKPNYNIRVQTSDSGGASYQKTLTIAVNNLNDAGVNDAPTDLTVSQLAVDENVAAGTVVGIFTTTDPDANNIFTYSLVTGSGDTDNAAFTVEGNQLKINSSPDFETKPSYNIRVQTSDSGGASYQKTLTIAVNNLDDAGVNDAPSDLTLSELTVDENVAAGSVVGTFITTDPDKDDKFTYSLVTGTGDSDNSAFTIVGGQLQINNVPNIETKSSYNIRVQTTDSGGVSYQKALTIAVNDLDDLGVNDIPTLTKSANNDIFTIKGKGNGEKAKLSVKLTGQSSNQIYELGVFTVDDEQGKIQGIASNDAGYTEAALKRGKVILSSLNNYPTGFNADLSSMVEFTSGQQLRFYLVRNSSTDSILAGQAAFTDVLISDSTNLKITSLGNNNFSLSWKASNSAEFQDLAVTIQATDEDLPLGTGFQGQQQGEFLDLRDLTQPVKADFVVNREAAYDNYVGFYKVADENGGIDTNGDGTADVLVGQAGYAQAAVSGRVTGVDLTTNNQGTATYSGTLNSDSLFAPFIIVDGKPDAILDGNVNNDPKVYFAFLGANSDNTDHIRLLANNTFGFEDLANGGDKDYNDIIVRVNLSGNPV